MRREAGVGAHCMRPSPQGTYVAPGGGPRACSETSWSLMRAHAMRPYDDRWGRNHAGRVGGGGFWRAGAGGGNGADRVDAGGTGGGCAGVRYGRWRDLDAVADGGG